MKENIHDDYMKYMGEHHLKSKKKRGSVPASQSNNTINPAASPSALKKFFNAPISNIPTATEPQTRESMDIKPQINRSIMPTFAHIPPDSPSIQYITEFSTQEINNNQITDDELNQNIIIEETEQNVSATKDEMSDIENLIRGKKYQEAIDKLNEFKDWHKYKIDIDFKINVLEKYQELYALLEMPKKALDVSNARTRAIIKKHYKGNESTLEKLMRIEINSSIDQCYPNVKEEKNHINPLDVYQSGDFLVYNLSKERINDFLASKNKNLENLFKSYQQKNQEIEKKETELEKMKTVIQSLTTVQNEMLANFKQQKKHLLETYKELWGDIESDESDIEIDLLRKDRKRIEKIQNQAELLKKEEDALFRLYKNQAQKVAWDLEIKRQHKVEMNFFDSTKITDENPKNMAKTIGKSRYSPDCKQSTPALINMTGLSARCLINAERLMLELSLSIQNRKEIADLYNTASYSPGINNNPVCRSAEPDETIQYDDILVNYQVKKNTKSKNHLGNGEIKKLGDYPNKVKKTLEDIIGTNAEINKSITSLIMLALSDGRPITSDDLKKIFKNESNEHDYELTLKKYSEFLMRLIISLLRETCRRASPQEKRHEIPYAVLIARGLILAYEGVIGLTDLFEEHSAERYHAESHPLTTPYGSMYGIFTAPKDDPIAKGDNIAKVHLKAQFINQKYTEHSLKKNNIADDPTKIFVLSRDEIYDELVAVFDGKDIAIKDGYSSDEMYERLTLS
ncbi:MAG: hypothetical protein K2Q14_00105 [Gammaproteobacteria bacterium]|nr:hypothetical protein [Gammaproteobacteria bacterium]